MLVVVDRAPVDRAAQGAVWRCACDCGASCVAVTKALKRGHRKSCGCLRRIHFSKWPAAVRAKKPAEAELRDQFKAAAAENQGLRERAEADAREIARLRRELRDSEAARDRTPKAIDGAAIVAKAIAELLAPIVGEDKASAAAITFMRGAPGSLIEIPPMEKCEQLARDQMILARWRRDPSSESVRHACDFHGVENREATRRFKTMNGRGLSAEREARAPS